MNKLKYLKFQNQDKVKSLVRPDTWCTAHVNCFRASFTNKGHNKPESEAHINKKFERWKFWKGKGFDILTEARLVNPAKSQKNIRPDLIVWNEYELFIEEIVASEKEESIINKKKIYPYHVNVVRI